MSEFEHFDGYGEDDAPEREAPEGELHDEARFEGDYGRKTTTEAAADILRRLIYTGIGAVMATEEGVRRAAGELPKEAVSFLINQAQYTKDEILRIVANELRRFLETMDFAEAIRKALASMTLEVKTEIRFRPGEKDLVKGIKITKKSVSVRRKKAAPPPETTASDDDDL